MQNQLSSCIFLTVVLMAAVALNVLRLSWLDGEVLAGRIVDGSREDALWYFMGAAGIDSFTYFIIYARKEFWLKNASFPIMWTLVAAGFAHFVGYIFWNNGLEYAETYHAISRALLIIEFAFLGYGIDGVLRRLHGDNSLSRVASATSDGGSGPADRSREETAD